MRIFLQDALGIRCENNSLYRYDETLGWFPLENSKGIYTEGSIPIHVEHNSRGFRDPEHVADNKPGILFLGDSFVWGFDVEKQERFTEKLRAAFANASIYNLGVIGYGTDQEYLLLKQHFVFYKPHIVFLVFCTDNDESNNSRNCDTDSTGHFKPYFATDGKNLTLKGVPVPKSWRYFLDRNEFISNSCWVRLISRFYFKYMAPPSLKVNDPTCAILLNMKEYVLKRQAKFIVGLVGVKGTNPKLIKCLEDNHIPWVDLNNPNIYPDHGMHWTPVGHTVASEKIFYYLMNNHYLEAVSR